MISYSLEVSVCWCLFFIIYIAALRKETFFSMNRWYLLSTLLLGLTLPLIRWIPLEGYQELQAVAEPLNFIASGPNVMVSSISEASGNHFPIFWVVGAIYLIGMVFFISRFANGLLKIRQIYSKGRKEVAAGYTLVHTAHKHLPFSFLTYVFISEVLPLQKDFREILKHELNHIQKKHTYDVLFVEIVHIIFWWNPMIYLYKKAMKETHEFMADASVLKETEEKIYGQILLRQSNSGLEIALAHQFFNSHLKSRIQMMYKDKSKRQNQIKYLMIIPLLFIMALAFSSYVEKTEPEFRFEEETSGPNSHMNTSIPDAFKSYAVIQNSTDENVGYVSGIIANNYYQNNLGETQTVYYLGEQVEAPFEGKISLGQPFCIHKSVDNNYPNKTKYDITLNGLSKIEDEPILENIKIQEVEESTTTVIEEESTLVKNVSKHTSTEDPIFKVVEEMPRFPGCEGMEGTAKEKEECAKQKMLEYIYTNITYPETARQLGIEGMTVVQFQVNADGTVSNESLVREIGGGCGEVSLNVVKSFNDMDQRWIPGKQQGKAVTVLYTLPVRYKLQDDDDVDDSSGDPICFVNGKEHSQDGLKTLDPNSIDNITVLKGEEAIKQYGEKGKNGVIVVTTKVAETETALEPSKTENQDDPIFKVVEEMPRFPGCEEITNKSERSECAQQAMLNYIYENLKYPEEARKAGVEGMVVIQFIVRKSGRLSDINIVREIGSQCGTNAAAVVEQMNTDGKVWSPGKQRGKIVDVMYTLPVRYKLADDAKEDPKKIEDRIAPKKASVKTIKIIGNPVQGGKLMFQFESEETTSLFTSLVSSNGQLIKEQHYSKQNDANQYILPLGDLPSGQYFFTISQSKHTVTESFIIP